MTQLRVSTGRGGKKGNRRGDEKIEERQTFNEERVTYINLVFIQIQLPSRLWWLTVGSTSTWIWCEVNRGALATKSNQTTQQKQESRRKDMEKFQIFLGHIIDFDCSDFVTCYLDVSWTPHFGAGLLFLYLLAVPGILLVFFYYFFLQNCTEALLNLFPSHSLPSTNNFFTKCHCVTNQPLGTCLKAKDFHQRTKRCCLLKY